MGPVPVVEEPEPWTRHAREVPTSARDCGSMMDIESEGQLWIDTDKRASRELFMDVGNSETNVKLLSQLVKSW